MADGGADLFGGFAAAKYRRRASLGQFYREKLDSDSSVESGPSLPSTKVSLCGEGATGRQSTHCPREHYGTFVQRPHHRNGVVLLQGSLLGSHVTHLLLMMRLQELEVLNWIIAKLGS